MVPSDEQLEIINTVASGTNVIVDAVAGSGKTSTVLFLAELCHDKKILQITYNSQLKSEVREKAIVRGLHGLEVHTYHSLVVRYYDSNGFTDAVMRRVVANNKEPRALPDIDILVIDEAQDMTPLYYRILRKLLADLGRRITLLIMGDRYQGIYDFKDADTRFLTLAKRLWTSTCMYDDEDVEDVEDVEDDENKNNAEYIGDDPNNIATSDDDDTENIPSFVNLSLRRTYRLTDQIARFVNEGLVGSNRIVAAKPGPPVTYLKYDIWTVHKHLAQYILGLIRDKIATSGDIFVLAGSVKSPSSPLRKLENELVNAGIPCFVPINEESVLDEEITKGKVIFTTFHQCKGRERPIVIVYGFDDSYFTYFCRTANRKVCPSTLYVAATRASKNLILVESHDAGPLPFMRYTQSAMRRMQYPHIRYMEGSTSRSNRSCGSRGNAYQMTIEGDSNEEIHDTSVTDLTRFLSLNSLDILTPLVERLFTCIVAPQKAARIPSKIRTAREPIERFEEVSDLNGLTIPAMYEAKHVAGGITTLHTYLSEEQEFIKREHPFLSQAIDAVAYPCVTISDYLYLGNVYTAVRDRLYFKLAQIKKGQYTWLDSAMVDVCHSYMHAHISPEANYEQELGDSTIDAVGNLLYAHNTEYGKVHIRGRVDAVDDNIVWEFKCVAALQVEHHLQIIVYAWLWTKCMEATCGRRRHCLMNIRTGEVRQLCHDNAAFDAVMDVLLKNKYGKPHIKSDDEFIKDLLQEL